MRLAPPRSVNLGVVPLAAVLAMAAPAAANLRAPYRVDGGFGAHLDAKPAHPDLVLMHETFAASLPAFTVGEQPPTHALLDVEYTIDNRSSAPVTLPVRFLAVGAQGARIEVNGAVAPHHEARDPEEHAAAVAVIARSRCRGIEGCEPDRIRAALEHELERGAARFDSLAFDATLAPGANVIRVRYAQALTLHEGAYGYFMRGTFGTRGARYGFDYLLFPAQSWRRAEGFWLDVRVDVADTIDRGWLGTALVPPASIDATLPLTVTRAPHPSTTLRARLDGFPVDVFTLTVRIPPS